MTVPLRLRPLVEEASWAEQLVKPGQGLMVVVVVVVLVPFGRME